MYSLIAINNLGGGRGGGEGTYLIAVFLVNFSRGIIEH
jgi:hypothetical protein